MEVLSARGKSYDPSAKLGIAAGHINAAIQMIAIDANPESVHVVVMAAEELIESIIKKSKPTLTRDFFGGLSDEGRAYWNTHKKKAYNFFKHAYRDYDGTKAPDTNKIREFNDLQLMILIFYYQDLVPIKAQHMVIFNTAVATLYPGVMDWEEMYRIRPDLRSAKEAILRDFSRDDFLAILQHALQQSGLMPNELGI